MKLAIRMKMLQDMFFETISILSLNLLTLLDIDFEWKPKVLR